jgi:hypothetical protein
MGAFVLAGDPSNFKVTVMLSAGIALAASEVYF